MFVVVSDTDKGSHTELSFVEWKCYCSQETANLGMWVCHIWRWVIDTFQSTREFCGMMHNSCNMKALPDIAGSTAGIVWLHWVVINEQIYHKVVMVLLTPDSEVSITLLCQLSSTCHTALQANNLLRSISLITMKTMDDFPLHKGSHHVQNSTFAINKDE